MSVNITSESLSVTAEFESASVDVPVPLADLRVAVDAALPLWGEAHVSVRIGGIWHTPEAVRIELPEPVDTLIPLDADAAPETADDYSDSHEVR